MLLRGYLRALRALADEHGIVLVCDEVQTGFGRTGRMFAYQHAGIEPDLVVVGKSLAGALPLSGVVRRVELMDTPEPGGLGGTYTGNPLACAAALAVLDLFEEEPLLQRARDLGVTLRDGLTQLQSSHDCIGDVRGLGPMLAFELVRDRDSKEPDAALAGAVREQARLRGLIVICCGLYRNIVRLLAPLVGSDEDAHEAIEILS